ncbi:MAG: hypothetical protein JF588_16125 [Caulobacterales bacterium]|nr:hypothetical protein [Caulobacterales bacterium]
MVRARPALLAALLAPAAALCLAAVHAPKAAPAKPAAPKPAAAPATARPAVPTTGPFDMTNPQGLMSVLDAAGAKVQTSKRDADSVFVAVTSPAANFSMQFAGCNEQGRACKAVLLDSALDSLSKAGTPVRLEQVNAFNQTSVLCRIYQAKDGTPHVLFSAVLSASATREDGQGYMIAWQGCLADGRDFVHDPVSYLANAA